MKRFCFLLLLLPFGVNAQGQSAEELLQQALTLERSQGDYSGAIALYKQVSETAGVERRLAGRALVQMARAYENMGRSEAARTYQRVLADFGDMPELATEARQGYARTRRTEPVDRTPLERDVVNLVGQERYFEGWGASLSPSGKFLSGATEYPPGVRFIEVETGIVTDIPLDPEGYGEFSIFSPDETKVALGWHRSEREPEAERSLSDAIIVDVATGSSRRVFDIGEYYEDPSVPTLARHFPVHSLS
ncbi:MAG: hypothetical protein ACI80V_002614 [Rhodothermales bacterium]|jgi:hypothetical protein